VVPLMRGEGNHERGETSRERRSFGRNTARKGGIRDSRIRENFAGNCEENPRKKRKTFKYVSGARSGSHHEKKKKWTGVVIADSSSLGGDRARRSGGRKKKKTLVRGKSILISPFSKCAGSEGVKKKKARKREKRKNVLGGERGVAKKKALLGHILMARHLTLCTKGKNCQDL